MKQYETLEESINISDPEFFFGIGLQDYYKKGYGKETWRHDPRMMLFEVELIEAVSDGPRGMTTKTLQTAGVHECTEEEWMKLYPAKNAMDKNVLDIVRESKGMLCINKKDNNGNAFDFRVYGANEDGSHRRIDVAIYPCRHI